MTETTNGQGCLSWVWQKDPQKDIDKENSKKLKKWGKEERKLVKLLLLGTGESGKSTISKQFKIIHVENGFTDEERRETIPYIKKNISDAILTIIGAMTNLNIKLEHEEYRDSVEFIMTHAVDPNFDYPQEFYDHCSRLWSDKGVQTSYMRAHEYQLFDSAKYFLDKVSEVRKPDYLPSNQDILRNRVMTNTILRMDFSVPDRRSNINFSVFDVGGQRGERRKWIQVFESITAILFVIDCSCFDLSLREDLTRNRLIEAFDTFEQTWNTKWLRTVSIIIFINKIDLLEEKVRNGKTLQMLIDRDDGNPYQEHFRQYNSWAGPTEGEVEEFANAYPSTNAVEAPTKKQKKIKLAQLIEEKQLSEQTIRTAVFIKRLLMELTTKPSTAHSGRRSTDWHSEHSCEYYYTCAVDTQTIQKVFEGCRSVLIQKHMERIGLS